MRRGRVWHFRRSEVRLSTGTADRTRAALTAAHFNAALEVHWASLLTDPGAGDEAATRFEAVVGVDNFEFAALAEAHEIIEDLMSRSVIYRGVLVAPCDIDCCANTEGLGFEFNGRAYRVAIDDEDPEAARDAAEAIIDRLMRQD